MPNKGINGLYEYCCDGKFYDWHFNEDSGEIGSRIGYLYKAPIFYKSDEIFTLTEDSYNIDEEKATFRITKFSAGLRGDRLAHRPYKRFNLESDDDLMLLKCKIRPVLVVKGARCDWRKPYNYFSNLWLCLPIFSYKDRHSQQYVINDQKLLVPHRFYFPPGLPGLEEECAGLLNELQFIPEQNLSPFKRTCDDREISMERPVRLTRDAFHSVVGHVAQLLPDIEISGQSRIWYDFFKELINERISDLMSRERDH